MFNGKFNIGDEVVVDNEICGKLNNDKYDVVEEMLKYGGKKATIMDCTVFDDSYYLDIDNREYQWCEGLLSRFKNVNSDLMDGDDCINKTKLHEGNENLDNVSYLPRVLKDCKDVYNGSDIITMIQDSELEDGDVYAIHCPTSTDVNFLVGSDNAPTMEELIKCDFVIIERKEYFTLSEAITIMMEDGESIRHRDWFDYEYVDTMQDILEDIFREAQDDNSGAIRDRVWEVYKG